MAFDAVLPYGGKEVEGLAARATLRVYLDQGTVSMTPADFFTFVGKLFEQTGVKSVYDVWFDRDVVYRVSKDHEKEDNHNEALAKAISFSESPKSHPKEVGAWSHGMSGEFYLELRLSFWPIHDAGAPSIVFEVSGNPRELTDPTGENQFELDDRLRRLESNKADIEKENAQISSRFEKKLQEIQGIIGQTLKVKQIDKTVKVDVASIW